MIKFQFIARSGDETLPLEVSLPYKPGRQVQRARRMAVGQLLAVLGIEVAKVDARGEDLVKVATPQGEWIIGEGRGVGHERGKI